MRSLYTAAAHGCSGISSGLRSAARLSRYFTLADGIQNPVRSVDPSGRRRAGAFRSIFPSAVRGTLFHGYGSHWANVGAPPASRTLTASRQRATLFGRFDTMIIPRMGSYRFSQVVLTEIQPVFGLANRREHANIERRQLAEARVSPGHLRQRRIENNERHPPARAVLRRQPADVRHNFVNIGGTGRRVTGAHIV